MRIGTIEVTKKKAIGGIIGVVLFSALMNGSSSPDPSKADTIKEISPTIQAETIEVTKEVPKGNIQGVESEITVTSLPSPTVTKVPTATFVPPRNTPYIPPPTWTPVPPTIAPVSQYTCNCAKTCPNLSCEEAYFQLNCGCTERDGDGDGIPCEAQCR